MNNQPDVDDGRRAATSASAAPPLRRRLISAGLWSFAGRGAAIGLFFLTDAVLARALSKGDFAAYYLATQATVFMAGLVALGSPQILSRTLRQVIYGPHPELAPDVMRASTRILIIGCTLGSVIFFVVRPWVIDDGDQWSLFRDAPVQIILWSCLAATCLNAAFALQGLDDFRSAVLVGSRRGGVLPNFAFLVLSFALWQLGKIDLKTLLVAQILLQGATAVYSRWIINRRLDALITMRAAAAPSGSLAEAPGTTLYWYFKEGLPFFASVLITLAIDELDGLWVGRLVDDVATAEYGAAKRLVRLMATPYVMFALSLAPFAAELLGKGQSERLERILRAASTLVSLPMLAAFTLFLLIPGPLLAIAFGEGFREAAPILQVLTLGQVVFVLLGFSSQVLLMGGRQKALMWVSLGALVGYCALTPVLTLKYGAVGAAVVQSAAFAGQAVANTLLARRYVGVWTPATLRPREIRLALQYLFSRGPEIKPAPEQDPAAPVRASIPEI